MKGPRPILKNLYTNRLYGSIAGDRIGRVVYLIQSRITLTDLTISIFMWWKDLNFVFLPTISFYFQIYLLMTTSLSLSPLFHHCVCLLHSIQADVATI